MTAPDRLVLDTLREVRDQIARPGTPSKVDLRQYLPPNSAAWKDFVRIMERTPGYNVRRATMVQWLDDVIAHLEGGAPPEPEQEAEGDAELEPPSPRDLHRAGDRTSGTSGAPARLDATLIERELTARAAATLDGDDLAQVSGKGIVIDDGMDDWYYGPEYDEAAQKERSHLTTVQREERERRWAERAREEAQASTEPMPAETTTADASPPPASRAPRDVPRTPQSHAAPPAAGPSSEDTPLRQLTESGIERARDFLTAFHEDPTVYRTPPHDLLYGERYSRPFSDDIRVEPRTFRTRREAGEYLAPLLAPIRHRITDHPGLWSWLGMYYFEGTTEPLVGRKRRMTDDAFVFSSDESTTEKRRSYQRRYRHILRGSWLLHERHGEDAAFLLDEDITTFGPIADRAFSDFRAFNSAGVIPLLMRLYTENKRPRTNYAKSRGGLRHLLRVLRQLELTYDVYGMEPDALLEVLPPAFQEWAST